MKSYKVNVRLQIKGDDRRFTYKFIVGLAYGEKLEDYIDNTFTYYDVIKYTFRPFNHLMLSDSCIQEQCDKLKRQEELEKTIR